jgi:hypothetical protein
MTAVAHRKRERERPPAAIINFIIDSGTQAQISTTTGTTSTTALFVGGYISGLQGAFPSLQGAWLPSGGGAVMVATLGGGSVTLSNEPIAASPSPPPEEYDPELAEQILQLAKEPPAAVFDNHEELMDWLNDIEK